MKESRRLSGRIKRIIGLCSFSAIPTLVAMPAHAATTICHYPPGNSANVQRITVGNAAVRAHVANHGDVVCTEGNDACCGSTCTNLATDSVNCGACGNACETGASCVDGTCEVATCGPIEDACFGQQACGDGCATVPPVEGGCFCHQSSFCDEVPSCTATSECPEGWTCAASCCDVLKCLPPCAGGAGLNAARLQGGARSTPQ